MGKCICESAEWDHVCENTDCDTTKENCPLWGSNDEGGINLQTPIKINALGPFACKVRREIGNCEQFQKCESRWDMDKNARCGIDPGK